MPYALVQIDMIKLSSSSSSWKRLLSSCTYNQVRSITRIEKKKPTNAIDYLDINVNSKHNEKLKKTLESKPKPVLDITSEGYLEATSEDLRDHLNELLESSQFAYVFKGVRNTSELITITKITINQDYSNVRAYWSAPAIKSLLKYVLEHKGENHAITLSTKIGSTIRRVLERKEGACRSYIMKKIEFRMTPRVQFYPYQEHFGVKKLIQK
jgi:ribosome-binding factor A